MRYFFFWLVVVFGLTTQGQTFTNPVLPGGHPDPSICRVGDTFYLVNSTFEYFPGLPIHRSTDLVNWELIGNALHREEQVTGAVNLVDVQNDGGIHAPTIRYYNDTFYVITTNVYHHPETKTTDFVNFILTATDPAGPWSMPHVIDGAPGIDPDLFFPGNGRVWYVGNRMPADPNFPGEGEIWIQELDLTNMRLIGKRHALWRGACGGIWAEGPHIYAHEDRFYLLIAEGGTSFNHAVMVAVSDAVTGPYTNNDRNPIFTTRHLSYDHWVHSTGHADLVKLADDRWYMVLLGVRGDQERGSNMGRETHLVPVEWEIEPFEWKEPKYSWPVVAPQTGRLEQTQPMPFAGTKKQPDNTFADEFELGVLRPQWVFRRLPLEGGYDLSAKWGHLRLHTRAEQLLNRGRSNWLGFRQTESDFRYTVRFEFRPRRNGSEAGMALVQKDNQFLLATVIRRDGENYLQLVLRELGAKPRVLFETPFPDHKGAIALRLDADREVYRFSWSLDDGDSWNLLGETHPNHLISSGYTGACLGLYATGNGKDTGDAMDVDAVEYQAFPR